MPNTVAIVGRPNVGKSTLFNRLTRSRTSLVDDQPGVTRDRISAKIEYEGIPMIIIDTGGFEDTDDPLIQRIRKQVEIAIDDADKIIFLLDAREGITPLDEELARMLRRKGKDVIVAANKVDTKQQDPLALEFYKLGLGKVFPISAAHGRGIKELMEEVIKGFSKEEEKEEEERIKVAIVGRPNVGKSSFINRVLGEERVIVSEEPGTTRDSIDTYFSFSGRDYLLIDTAGIRRRSRVKERLEKFSVIKALNSIERSHVTVLMIDAVEGATDQDAHICGYAFEQGKGIVIAVNKWDLIKRSDERIRNMMDSIERKLRFVDFAPKINISALTGENIMLVFEKINLVYDQMKKRVKTSFVNKVLEEIQEENPPPMKGRKRLKIYYGTQVEVLPPTFVLFVNSPKLVKKEYERFLINQFRKRLGFENSPIRLLFRERPRKEKKK